MSYRTYQPSLAPGFLSKPFGNAYMVALGAVKDALAARAMQGIQQRFPGIAQADALAMLGAERGIPQGLSESIPNFVAALLNAWNIWELAGSPWGILGLLNVLGYSTCYLQAKNGLLYGPSGSVVLPSASGPGTPPAVSANLAWTISNGAAAYGQQGPTVVPRQWQGSTAFVLNAVISPYPATGQFWKCTTAGTTGTTQPTWSFTVGATVSDGSVVWTNIGGQEASPIGQAQGQLLSGFWSTYLLVFDGEPVSWTNLVNPPTATSSPSKFEIQTIQVLLSLFGPGFATCAGILVVDSAAATRATFGWPSGVTFSSYVFGANKTAPITYWFPHTAYALNAIAIPTAPNGHWYYCTTGGTGGYSQPIWPTTNGATVADGSVVWTCGGVTAHFVSGAASTVLAFSPQDPYD